MNNEKNIKNKLTTNQIAKVDKTKTVFFTINGFKPPMARATPQILERERGLEPPTSSLARKRSTTELLARIFVCGGRPSPWQGDTLPL